MDTEDTFKSSDNDDFNKYREKCLSYYIDHIKQLGTVDVGHCETHVKQVEQWAVSSLDEKPIDKILEQLNIIDNRPDDVKMRVMIASLLHEIGDHKMDTNSNITSKTTILENIIEEICHDYIYYSDEFRDDIIKMIDLCSASKWGDRIPPNTLMYQLIPSWVDRHEATGSIGLVRCLLYAYHKKEAIISLDDIFPTDITELNKIAPYSRFISYSNGRKSISAFSHLLDKIRHINGNNIPIPSLNEAMNNGQHFIDSFIIDFSTKHSKIIDFHWLISLLDSNVHNKEINQLYKLSM